VITDGTIQTTKEPKEEHGFGLANVCRILDQLGAEYTFSYENGTFQFVAEIP
jgi:sensor histidine kinase regulating citrate/malate metabolism